MPQRSIASAMNGRLHRLEVMRNRSSTSTHALTLSAVNMPLRVALLGGHAMLLDRGKLARFCETVAKLNRDYGGVPHSPLA